MKSRLPNNLNPNLFKRSLDVYADDYKDRYSVELGRWGFLIDNAIPFTVYLAAAFTGRGEDLHDRDGILDLLRIAEHIHRVSGKWPSLDDEWEEMCPGGLVKLDVTPLAAVFAANPRLPEVLQTVGERLDAILAKEHVPFAKAEQHYAKQLSGLAVFSAAVRSIQRDFDEHPVCVLNANTKVRRLRFLEVIARSSASGVKTQKLASLVLNWAANHIEELQAYADPKGAILESTGLRSVTPYTQLAEELGILTSVGRGVTITNSWRALVLLVSPQDTFSLCYEERLFFLFDLLAHDRDVIWPLLLELRHGTHRKRHLRAAFPTAYKAHLIGLRRYCGTLKARQHIDETVDRVGQWQRPEIYMEHVVDPRLSWFVDLQLCYFEKDRVGLTTQGEKLAAMLAERNESQLLPFTKEYLCWQYFKQVAPCLRERPPEKTSKPSRDQLVNPLRDYCNFIRQNTKSLAPNRIVASTLFRYAGVRLFIDHSIAADFRDLAKFLEDQDVSSSVSWKLRWQTAQDDGYLTPSDPLKN